MDTSRPRPLAKHLASVPKPAPHRLSLSQICRHTGQPCGLGLAMLEKLRAAVAMTVLGEEFEISGMATFENCTRPCMAAWRASAKAAWFFGDVDPGVDIEELVALAARCEREADRCDRPERPIDPAPARLPAAIIVTRVGTVQ